MHMSLVLIPVFFFLAQHDRLVSWLRMRGLVWVGSLTSLLLIPLFFVSSEGVTRLTPYFYFVPMMIYPAAIWAYSRSVATRIFITIAIGALHIGILAIWLSYANHSPEYLPYRNLLFAGGL